MGAGTVLVLEREPEAARDLRADTVLPAAGDASSEQGLLGSLQMRCAPQAASTLRLRRRTAATFDTFERLHARGSRRHLRRGVELKAHPPDDLAVPCRGPSGRQWFRAHRPGFAQ